MRRRNIVAALVAVALVAAAAVLFAQPAGPEPVRALINEAITFLAVVVAVGVFTIQRWDMRRRELWWAIVQDASVEKGVPISFRTYRYIGKTRPPKKLRRPSATVIRGSVIAGEALIGRERMGQLDAIRHMRKRSDQGERQPEVPDEIHPPKITMVPLRVIH